MIGPIIFVRRPILPKPRFTPEEKQEISANIRAIMKERNYSQATLAARTRFSRNTIGLIIHSGAVSMQSALNVARELDVPTSKIHRKLRELDPLSNTIGNPWKRQENMVFSEEQKKAFGRTVLNRLKELEMSLSKLARVVGVDVTRTSQVVDGEFKTLSPLFVVLLAASASPFKILQEPLLS